MSLFPDSSSYPPILVVPAKAGNQGRAFHSPWPPRFRGGDGCWWIAGQVLAAALGLSCRGWWVLATHHRSGVEHGADDFVIAGAAAEIAGEPIARLFLSRILVLVEQRLRGDDEPRCAKATLQCGMLEELLLHRMQFVALGDALDRRDLAALGFGAEHQA